MFKLINADILKADFSDVKRPNLIVTSPPYNVGIEYDGHVDTMTYEQYLVWCKQWLTRMFELLDDNGRICINIPFTITPIHENGRKKGQRKKKGVEDINYPILADYTRIAIEVGFRYWRTLIWDKSHSNKTCWGSWRSASAPFMRDPSEAILVFHKTDWKRKDKGISTITGPEFMSWTKNVWKIHPETKSKHPAAFPAELPERCIKLFSYLNDTIFDPFMGSGTTGMEAVRLGRNFVGVEMSADYYTDAEVRISQTKFQTDITNTFNPEPKPGINEAW